jgi:hypothetical protein
MKKNGRDDWIRTSDPLLPKQMRYQAAPRPDGMQVFEVPTELYRQYIELTTAM